MILTPVRAYCLAVVLALPAPASRAQDMSAWYRFEPNNTPAPGEIGMQDWLDKPAGRHGHIVARADKLYYDGRPIKLWGLNLCYSACAPEKDLADRRAAFYPKYGINSVRLHKFADGAGWAGIQAENSCIRFDPENLDRMDYQVAQFKAAGIYVTLSAHFGSMKLGPDDRKFVPYLEEFGSFDNRRNRIATPHSGIHYSPELQDVHIRQMVNLLEHRNPYTGLTYAEDPAIAFVEIINEQSILFYTSMNPLKASPTLRRQVAERFSEWLRERYGHHDDLVQAWGEKALDSFAGDDFPAGEHLDRNNILPLGNPYYWDPKQLQGSESYRRQRLLDTLQFLYGLQCGFYDRYTEAVREAGYRGELLASNWQAGRALSHFYNLHSDSRVGAIDRHNYFGGGSLKPGERFNNASMLRVAGSGTLSVGLQQVADRPFMLSEWIHVFPNEWGAEGPALLGAYGYGLQGWDVSYMFQNRDAGRFSERIGGHRWDVTAPQVLGVFPAVARQILRGDVSESEQQATMFVHVPSLAEMRLGFDDRVKQQHDVKTFDTDKVPARALAVARCAVEFTDRYRDTPAFDIDRYERDGSLVSSTGELRWTEATGENGGYFTIDTSGTKAVVGFAKGKVCRLGDVTIEPQSHFAAIYVTAQRPNEDIGRAEKLLVLAVARARNADMKLNETEDALLERGGPPVLMEPVKARITISGRSDPIVHLLDHDGLRAGAKLATNNRTFVIDGSRDKTPYYLIEL